MKEKLLLIAGCSHASGSEMDGSQDSEYNRKNSFGNLLAEKIGRKALNIASHGSANSTITRVIIEWVNTFYDPEKMDLEILVAWTESFRMEIPVDRPIWYDQWNPYSDYISKVDMDFLRVNMGYKGGHEEERIIIAGCQEFIAKNVSYMEIASANLVLQLQYFLQTKNIKYIMCNTMEMFSENPHLNFYINQIDKSPYMDIMDNKESFYWKYKNAGYKNAGPQFWHHGPEPHRLFAEKLRDFYYKVYPVKVEEVVAPAPSLAVDNTAVPVQTRTTDPYSLISPPTEMRGSSSQLPSVVVINTATTSDPVSAPVPNSQVTVVEKKTRLPFFYDYVMPNIVLPNALAPEMGIVNYLHTLYSNRLSSESFYEENLDGPNSPLKQMFGEEMGDWPNSLRMGGSHLRHWSYKELVDIYENSLYFGNQTLHADGYNKYIYPIKVTLHFGKFTGTDRVGSKLNGEYFWKHMSAQALEDVRKKNAIIFLDWANEPCIERYEFEDFHRGLQRSGIPKEQIVLSINSFNAEQVYNSWFPEDERCMIVKNMPFLLVNISAHFKNRTGAGLTESQFYDSRNYLRRNHFMFPNRRSRDHRVAMIYQMAKENLLDLGDWSMLDYRGKEYGYYISKNYGFECDNSVVDRLHEVLPHRMQDEPDAGYNNTSGWGDKYGSTSSKNAYLYIASEGYIHGEYKSFTEKVFKAIANFHPFIFIAFPGALAELRNIGFRTFDPWIDESFDNVLDNDLRMRMMFAEIKRICSMSKEEIHKWYWQMEEILVHNRNHLLGIYKDEAHSKELVRYLSDRVVKG